MSFLRNNQMRRKRKWFRPSMLGRNHSMRNICIPNFRVEDIRREMCGLSLYCANARQYFAFDGFEQRAASGGDVGYLVGKSEFVDASNRVSAADE